MTAAGLRLNTRALDIPIGTVFGSWTVIKRDGTRQSNRNAQWLCKCACGSCRTIDAPALRHGKSTSCGCSSRGDMAEKIAALSTPEPNTGCWLWLGALNDRGYGRVKQVSRFRRAHIVSWELQRGPVPDGLCIDHLCRVKSCVNPDHMEPVTKRENTLRAHAFRRSQRDRD